MSDLLLVLPFIALCAFYTGAETGLYSVNRIRLRLRARQPNASISARALHAILANPHLMVATTLAGADISTYLAAAYCTRALTDYGLAHAELWATLAISPVLLIAGQIIPKAFFARHANTLMYPLAPVIRATTFALYPIVILMKSAMAAVDTLFGEPESHELGQISQLRLMHFLEESREEGVLTAHEDWMARNIMKLEKTKLRDVMVPIGRVVSVPRNATVDDLRDVSRVRIYSRVPVYEGDNGNIIGIVGLVEYLCDCSGKPVAEFIRQAPRLNENMTVNEALLTLRRTRDHMGLVVNNAGKFVGIATIKDLVEEIVGELAEW